MSQVERLQDELALAKGLEPLEKAREKMHANRTPANIAAYKEQCEKVTALRSSFREKSPPIPFEQDGNAAPAPDTVRVKGEVQNP